MEQLFEIARRHFDTPEFRGITFIESEAKSIINKVPGNFLPFNWTINPYRGCTHACSYCQAGDTPVLMADGGIKPLAKIEAGDRIYGTEFRRVKLEDPNRYGLLGQASILAVTSYPNRTAPTIRGKWVLEQLLGTPPPPPPPNVPSLKEDATTQKLTMR